MAYWRIKKDINPLAIAPTLQYSNTPNLIEIQSPQYGLPSFGVQIHKIIIDPCHVSF
jgi:hypothetical protein